jgi:ribonuclease HI
MSNHLVHPGEARGVREMQEDNTIIISGKTYCKCCGREMPQESPSQEMKNIMRIYCDGSSKGNPGLSAYAFRIVHEGIVCDKAEMLEGTHTNNEAEYYAILRAMQFIDNKNDVTAIFNSDSELIINQLNRIYKVKEPRLRKLRDEILLHSHAFKKCIFNYEPDENVEINDVHMMCEQVQKTKNSVCSEGVHRERHNSDEID